MRTKLTLPTLLILMFLLSCTKDSNPDDPIDPDRPTIPTIPPNSEIAITEIRPTHGRFGTTDTIIGKGFDKIPMPDSVLLNGNRLDLISKTNEQIIVKVPPLAGSGTFTVWYNGKEYQSPVFTYDSTLCIKTLAGSKTEEGYVDGLGLNARFRWLNGIAVDKDGNVFVSENRNKTIRKITPQGLVTTIAGHPGEGDIFKDGKGLEARFAYPEGMEFDDQGYLYVADMGGCLIRKISPNGDVSTFAGLGPNFMPWDGFRDGNLSVATFANPADIAIDKDRNVYVADMSNNKIRKITPQGYVSTVAGGDYYTFGLKDGRRTDALFSQPRAIAIAPSGTLFVIEATQRVRKISPEGDVITLLKPGSNPQVDMFGASAITTDKAGNVLFVIPGAIMKMTPDGVVSRYTNGAVFDFDNFGPMSSFVSVNGISFDDAGSLYVTDYTRVRKIFWQ